MSDHAYAGIGSRETPENILSLMKECGAYLSSLGYILRSGGAKGADLAFQKGCDSQKGIKNIYYASNASIHPEWFDHASRFHPAWGRCSEAARQLHARNSAIICGGSLKDPVKFVLCWTKDGAVMGGTGQSLRVALAYNIPIYNLFFSASLSQLWEDLS